MVRQKLYFDEVFADLMLMHVLNHATFKGAEIGECLAAAAKVVEGNPASWRQAWQEQGEQAERAGKAHPTVIIGDNTSEELYYWVGPPGVERGYDSMSSRSRTAPSSTARSTTSASSTASCSTGWTKCSASETTA